MAQTFVRSRLAAVRHAAVAFGVQLFLAVDQAVNVLLPGLLAVAMAAGTGRRQNVAFADETLSAHAWRAFHRGRLWGVVLMPVIDLLFAWQGPDEEVNRAAGFAVTGHCERAYWKERVRRNLPPEYRDPGVTP